MLAWFIHPHRVKQVLKILHVDLFNIIIVFLIRSCEQRVLLRRAVVVHLINNYILA